MKIRNGFISNSSSSSFILIFNNNPTLADWMQRFKEEVYRDEEYNHEYPKNIELSDFETVYSSFKEIQESYLRMYATYPSSREYARKLHQLGKEEKRLLEAKEKNYKFYLLEIDHCIRYNIEELEYFKNHLIELE